MRIGSSLVLIAIGAILKFAVTTSVSGISLSTVGGVFYSDPLALLVFSALVNGCRPGTFPDRNQAHRPGPGK